MAAAAVMYLRLIPRVTEGMSLFPICGPARKSTIHLPKHCMMQ